MVLKKVMRWLIKNDFNLESLTYCAALQCGEFSA